MRAAWHEVTPSVLASLDHDRRLTLLVRRLAHNVTRESGDLVHFFVQRDPFLQVLELHRAADFCEDREGVWIPFDQHLTELYMIAIADFELRAVHDRVPLFFAATLVNDRDGSSSVHDHQVSGLRLHSLEVDEAHRTVVFGFES